LAENKAKDQLDADKRMWAEAVARWSRSPEAIAAVYAKQFEATEGKLASFTRDSTTGAADPLFEQRSAKSFDVSLLGSKNYLVTAYTSAKSPLRIVVYNADDPASIIDTTVFITDGPLTVLEIPAGSPGSAKIAVISEAGPQGHPDSSPVPFKLAVYWPVGKPPSGSGQQSGQSPSGAAPPSAPPNAPPRGSEPAPSGGDEGGGDVGQTP
jgi:hypothetical protein